MVSRSESKLKKNDNSVDNAHSNNGRLFDEFIEEYDGMKGENRAEFDAPTMPNEIMMNFDRDTKEGEAEGPGDQELVSFRPSIDLSRPYSLTIFQKSEVVRFVRTMLQCRA